MRAQLPSGQGFWPAFWMVRDDNVWPPEVDIFEQSTTYPDHLLGGVLSNANGVHSSDHLSYQPNLSSGMHTFGLSWRPDVMRFYVDGREVASTATPGDLNGPMYMIATLAVGDNTEWPGAPTTGASATMTIDYIRAYQYTDIAPYVPTAQTMKVLTGTTAADALVGGAGGDRIEGGLGSDTLTGGAGKDTFVFANVTGSDTIADFQPLEDEILIQGFTSAQVFRTYLAEGTQLSFGTNKVLIAGDWWFGDNDIITGATTTSGRTAADTIDCSAIVTPSASIYGLAGADTLKGGAGDDWIVGGAGNDVMTASAGADTFYFVAGSGQDRITDFVPDIDRLVIQGATQSSLKASSANVGGVDGIQLNYGTSADSVFLASVTTLQQNSIWLVN